MRRAVLGIDPGFASMGVAIVELWHKDRLVRMILKTTSKSPKKRHVLAREDNVVRAQSLYRFLRAVVRKYDPKALCAEGFSAPRNASAAAKVALSWGVIISICERYKIPIVQVSPQAVKKAVCRGGTTKADVRDGVVRIFGRRAQRLADRAAPPSKQEHVFDAAAVVVACRNGDVLRLLHNMSRQRRRA